MLLDLENLNKKYNLEIKGVLHIGAHYGQEFSVYEKMNLTDVIFFEPLPQTFMVLQENIGNKAKLVNKALGNDNKKVIMNVESANKGMSSSILKPNIHLLQYPHIKFETTIEVDMVKLDDYILSENLQSSSHNFINIDVQGYELEVFKGAKDTLNRIDYIMTEVNREFVYENNARIEEIDSFLSSYGFERVETTWDGITWGDAFYVKNKKQD
jgi:FkbM family methyltransferase